MSHGSRKATRISTRSTHDPFDIPLHLWIWSGTSWLTADDIIIGLPSGGMGRPFGGTRCNGGVSVIVGGSRGASFCFFVGRGLVIEREAEDMLLVVMGAGSSRAAAEAVREKLGE